MRRAAVLFLVGCLAGAACAGSGAEATDRPTPAAPTAAPTATVATGYSDAEQEALVRENIELVYCGTEPQSSWCQYLTLIDALPVVVVDGTSLFVGVSAATPVEIAEGLCRDLGIASFDDNAEPIGYRHIHIQSGPESFPADCDVP